MNSDLTNIILSDFQQYRTLLAKVIQFFVSPEKCKNQRYKFCLLTDDIPVKWYFHISNLPGLKQGYADQPVITLYIQSMKVETSDQNIDIQDLT